MAKTKTKTKTKSFDAAEDAARTIWHIARGLAEPGPSGRCMNAEPNIEVLARTIHSLARLMAEEQSASAALIEVDKLQKELKKVTRDLRAKTKALNVLERWLGEEGIEPQC